MLQTASVACVFGDGRREVQPYYGAGVRERTQAPLDVLASPAHDVAGPRRQQLWLRDHAEEVAVDEPELHGNAVAQAAWVCARVQTPG